MADTIDFDSAVTDIQEAIDSIDLGGISIPTLTNMGQFVLNMSNIVAGKLDLDNPFNSGPTASTTNYPDELPDMPDLPSAVATLTIPDSL